MFQWHQRLKYITQHFPKLFVMKDFKVYMNYFQEKHLLNVKAVNDVVCIEIFI